MYKLNFVSREGRKDCHLDILSLITVFFFFNLEIYCYIIQIMGIANVDFQMTVGPLSVNSRPTVGSGELFFTITQLSSPNCNLSTKFTISLFGLLSYSGVCFTQNKP